MLCEQKKIKPATTRPSCSEILRADVQPLHQDKPLSSGLKNRAKLPGRWQQSCNRH